VTPHGSPIDESGKTQHSEWDPVSRTWIDKRIPHELRDVEFEPRLRDTVTRFMQQIKEIDKKEKGYEAGPYAHPTDHPYDAIKPYIETYLDIKYHDQPRRDLTGWIEWGANPWFWYLKKHDRKRYTRAMKKFMAEINRRGVMKKIPLKPAYERIPMKTPNHDAWGKVVTEYMQDSAKAVMWDKATQTYPELTEEKKYKEEVKLLKEYGRFIDSLDIEQLSRHKTIATKRPGSMGKEYWLTPRWQKHMKKPLSDKEMASMRANVPEHPLLRRNR